MPLQSTLIVSSSSFFLACLSSFSCIVLLFRHIEPIPIHRSQERVPELQKKVSLRVVRLKAIIVTACLAFLCLLRGVFRLSAAVVLPRPRQGLLNADAVMGAFLRFALTTSWLYIISRLFSLSSKLRRYKTETEESSHLKPWYIVGVLFVLVCATLTTILRAVILDAIPPVVPAVFTLISILSVLPVLAFSVVLLRISFVYAARKASEKHSSMQPEEMYKSPASTTFLVPPKDNIKSPIRISAKLRVRSVLYLANLTAIFALLAASFNLALVFDEDRDALIVLQTICEALWTGTVATLIKLLACPATAFSIQICHRRDDGYTNDTKSFLPPAPLQQPQGTVEESDAEDERGLDITDLRDPFAATHSPVLASFPSLPDVNQSNEKPGRLSAQWGAIPALPPPSATVSRTRLLSNRCASEPSPRALSASIAYRTVKNKRSLNLRPFRAPRRHRALSVPEIVTSPNQPDDLAGMANQERHDVSTRGIEEAMLAQLLLRTLEGSASES